MIDFRDCSVLVTGGNGAVGSNLVRKLLDLEAKVTILDDYSQSKKGNLQNHENLKIINGNILDEKCLNQAFSSRFDYVFHLAARFANELSVRNPIEDLKVNIQGTLQVLLKCAKQQHLERFVYTSSSSIYGPQNMKKFKETLSPKPFTPYAVSKLCGEHYCNAIHELYGMNYTIVRLSNSYGPFDPPGKYRNVIPNFFNNAIQGNNLIITGTGMETRDFTYVDDCINGLLLAATAKHKNEMFNLGTGKETQIKKIADLILEITNSKSKIIFKPMRNFDHVKHRRMDISKAKLLLNYKPNTNVRTGLEKTHDWFLNR